MAGVKMRVGQLAQGLGEIGRACAASGLQARCFFEYLDGGVIRAAIFQHFSQCAGGARQRGMSWREFLPVDGQGLAHVAFGVVEFSLRIAQQA